MENERLNIFAPGRRLKTLLLFAAAAACLVIFGPAVRNVLTVVFGGTVIAFLLLPMVKFYEKKLSPPKSALLALFSTVLALLISLALLMPVVLPQIVRLAEELPQALQRLSDSIPPLNKWLPQQSLFPGIGGSLGSFAKDAFTYAGSLAGKAYKLFLMAVLSYFLLADRKRILLRAELLLPSSRRKLLIRHGSILVSELRMYIRGQATIALCVGSIAAFALMLIGVPGGIVLGGVVGIFNMIPYFGPILGGIPVVLLALGESWQKAAFALAALVLVQQIDGTVISPRVMGNATGFSPAVVLLALYAASSVFGIAGLLFAMPALMAIRTLYRVFVQRYEKN